MRLAPRRQDFIAYMERIMRVIRSTWRARRRSLVLGKLQTYNCSPKSSGCKAQAYLQMVI